MEMVPIMVRWDKKLVVKLISANGKKRELKTVNFC